MHERSPKNSIVVCGPTASGKTRLGVEIALAYGGEIISCDSRQVYKRMDIGTGKDLAEYRSRQGTVHYHLIDIVEPDRVYSLYNFQNDFYRTFTDITSRGRLPVIVGGTGLYLEAVLKGYDIPSAGENKELRAVLSTKDKAWLEEELRRLDPIAHESTDCSSKKRIIRSIEVVTAGARQYVKTETANNRPVISPVVLRVTWERALLHERIEQRLRQRFDQGMVDEVRALLASGVPAERFALFGMEYKHIGRYLNGEVGYDTMFRELFQSIRHLAKRQETWFRGMPHRGIEIHEVEMAEKRSAFEAIGKYAGFEMKSDF